MDADKSSWSVSSLPYLNQLLSTIGNKYVPHLFSFYQFSSVILIKLTECHLNALNLFLSLNKQSCILFYPQNNQTDDVVDSWNEFDLFWCCLALIQITQTDETRWNAKYEHKNVSLPLKVIQNTSKIHRWWKRQTFDPMYKFIFPLCSHFFLYCLNMEKSRFHSYFPFHCERNDNKNQINNKWREKNP